MAVEFDVEFHYLTDPDAMKHDYGKTVNRPEFKLRQPLHIRRP